MTTKRKRTNGTHRVPRAATTPLIAAETRGRAYPGLGELLGDASLASLLRRAALGGAALSAVALGGCEAPVCEPTRIGELGAHTGQAASLLARLALSDGATEFGVGLGVVPHSSIAVAGEMVAVMPTPLPAPAIPPAPQPNPAQPAPEPAPLAPQPGPQLPLAE